MKYESDRYKIFVDCFNGGALLTEKNCQRFLTEAGYGFDERYLQHSAVRAILSRMASQGSEDGFAQNQRISVSMSAPCICPAVRVNTSISG